MAPRRAVKAPVENTKKRKAADDGPPPAAPKRARKQAPVASKKRKADDDAEVPAAPKRAKKQEPAVTLPKKGKVINEAPTQRLDVYVCGEGGSSELGLGTAKNAKPVRRPRINALLDKDTVGVVQLDCGGMHVIALTHDSKILTWGVNDAGALGRETKWAGGNKSIDAEDSDSENEDSESPNGLNPFESVPTEVDWSSTPLPADTKFTQVAAGDCCSFAVTDDGKVYGWGTFRDNNGVFGFTKRGNTDTRPVLIEGLKDITSVKCGSNHAIALDKHGATFSWGVGDQDQLGRRLIVRDVHNPLAPRSFGLPKGPKTGMRSIHSGNDFGFAISKSGDLWSWGLNTFGQTGLPDGVGDDGASIARPRIVPFFKGKNLVDAAGGSFHSIVATKSGDCYGWGRIDSDQIGIEKSELEKLPEEKILRGETGKLRAVIAPQIISAIDGKVVSVAAASEHGLAVTEDGEAYSWGFGETYQTGQGEIDGTVPEATLLDNSAVRGKKLVGAGTGGQFSVLMGV